MTRFACCWLFLLAAAASPVAAGDNPNAPAPQRQSGYVDAPPAPVPYTGVRYAPRWTDGARSGGAPSPYYMGGAVHTLHARGYDAAMHR